MTSIAVIIPTFGDRPSLGPCVASVTSQLGEEDEVIVMVDESHDPDCAQLGHPQVSWYLNLHERRAQFGHPSRNLALDHHLLPQNTHVWSLDDDDIAHPGAVDAIHALVDLYEPTAPERWFAFQMHFGPNSHAAGHAVWREQKVELGNIGTPCIVMPTSAKSRWGTMGTDPRTGWSYGAGYFGDYELARDLEAELGPPVWVPHVVCEVRPAAIASDA